MAYREAMSYQMSDPSPADREERKRLVDVTNNVWHTAVREKIVRFLRPMA